MDKPTKKPTRKKATKTAKTAKTAKSANAGKFYEFKVGCPPKYNSDLCYKILPLFKKGYSPDEVAAELGVCAKTLYNWRDAYPDTFGEAFAIGSTFLSAWYDKVGKGIMTGEFERANANVWSMAKKNLCGWKDKIETENHNTNYTYTIYKEEEKL